MTSDAPNILGIHPEEIALLRKTFIVLCLLTQPSVEIFRKKS